MANLINTVIDYCFDTAVNKNSNIYHTYTSGNTTITIPTNTNYNYTVYYDPDYNPQAIENEPAIHTTQAQLQAHEMFPALEQAWQDYLAIYRLTKGQIPEE